MDDYNMYVKVPASTANLGPGFDSVGMALQLYTTLKVKQSNRTKFYLVGDNQENIPTDKSNLIYQAIDFLYKKAGLRTPELEIEVDTDIPLARGLGSSGTAIAGGLVAANVLAGEPFSKQEIFQFASEIEGHPDNVGASIFGGIIVAAKNELGDYAYVPLLPPKDLKVVVAIPDFELPTKLAREVLPGDYSRQDVVHALSHSALLVAAIAKGDFSALQVALEDRIHQPYRMSLLPGFEELQKNCRNYGAFGTVISGAGPTILAFTTGECTQLVDFMESTLQSNGVSAKVMELAIDTGGTTCSVLLKK